MNRAFHRIFFLSGLLGMAALPLGTGCGDDTSGIGGAGGAGGAGGSGGAVSSSNAGGSGGAVSSSNAGGSGGAVSSSNAGGSGGAGGSETQGTLVTAAEGGTVTAPGGATLVIPPNALAQDTYITVTEASTTGLPDAGSIESLVLDFGPDGLEFLLPATISIPTPASMLEAGEQYVISTLGANETAWTDLDTTSAASTLSAPVDHFSLFTVRVIGGPGAACEELVGCGGDLSGTWSLPANGEGCLSIDGDFIPNCEGESVSADIDFTTFTLHFETGGTYGLTGVGDVTATLALPKSCLANQPCSALDPACVDENTTCLCPSTEVFDSTEQGTWSVSGNTVTLTSSDGDVQTWTYCVTGTTLDLYQVEVDPEDGATETTRLSLVKQ